MTVPLSSPVTRRPCEPVQSPHLESGAFEERTPKASSLNPWHPPWSQAGAELWELASRAPYPPPDHGLLQCRPASSHVSSSQLLCSSDLIPLAGRPARHRARCVPRGCISFSHENRTPRTIGDACVTEQDRLGSHGHSILQPMGTKLSSPRTHGARSTSHQGQLTFETTGSETWR